MNPWHRHRLPAVASVLVVIATLSACTPDRWSVLQPDYDRILADMPETPVDVPDGLEPETSGAAPVELEALMEGDALVLSREHATLLALRRNLEIQVQQLNPVIAGTFEQIERGVYDPELFARFDYQKEVSSETARSTGEQFAVEGDDIGGAAGVRQRLPSGTDLELSVGQDRSISNRAPEQQEGRVGLSITQSLLEGFGPAVNLARVRQARLEAVASAYELRGFVQSIVAETEIAYWQYVLARQEIDIFERSLEVARQQSEEIDLRIEVGTLAENEAAAARAEVALREQALIDARSLLEDARLRLLRFLNAGPLLQPDLTIQPASDPAIEPDALTDAADRIRLALDARPDLNQARLQHEQDRLEVVVTRNGLLPRLDLFADLGMTGFSDEFGESFKEIRTRDTYDYSIGFAFSHYLGNRIAEARDRAAQATRQQSAEAVRNLSQLVELEVLLALNEVERARQQIAQTRVSRLYQEETLHAEQERFEVGTSTSLLVAQAQRDLLASRIAEVEAVIAYRIALVQLYLAEGSLLERRGIQLAAEDEE